MVDLRQAGADHPLAALAARQHGVVSVGQLHEFGLSTAAVHARASVGRLHRVHHGVYAVGHTRLTLRGRWMAAVLAGGEGAVLSHRAALALWDLRPTPSGPIDIAVVAGGRRARKGLRVHCVSALPPADRARVDGIPVTSVPRTLLDYATRMRPQWLRLAVEEAERRDLLDGRALDQLLARHRGRAGTAALREAVNQVNGGPAWSRSELERRFLALVRNAGLREPQTNVIVGGDLVDCYWPEAALIVELDSYLFHRGRAQFERDRERDTAQVLAGRTVLRYTDRRLAGEPERVTGEVRAMLGRRAV